MTAAEATDRSADGVRAGNAVLTLPRVMRLLDVQAPITVVRGMQGYGKTAQVEEWIRAQTGPLRALWLTATAYSDPQAEIVARIREFAGATGTPATLISRPRSAGASAAPDQRRALIVIDDAHHFTDADALQWLIGLVQHGRVRVILNSRGPHPIQRAAVGRAEMQVIPAGHLLLRADEMAALAASFGVQLSPLQIAELQEEFGGWPAAVRLVLADMAAGRSDHALGLPLDRARRYLRDTVLPGVVSTEILHVTMRFALAEQLSHALLRDFADEEDPERLIRLIETAGFAELQDRDGERLLTLPRFVRDTLREAYSERFPKDALELHRRLSDWYAAHSRGDNMLFAMRHAVRAQDWRRFDRLWSDEAGFRTALTLPAETLEMLEEVPEAASATRPSVLIFRRGLAAALGESQIGGRWAAALRAYAHVSARFGPADLKRMRMDDALLVAAGHLIARRLGLPHADQDMIVKTIEFVLAQGEQSGSPSPLLSWYYLQLGNAHLAQLRLSESSQWYLRGWQSRPALPSASATVLASNAALVHAVNAQPRVARRWLELGGDASSPILWTPRHASPGSSLARAWLALDELDPQLEMILAGIDGDVSVESELWPLAASLRAQYELLRAAPAPAIVSLEQALSNRAPRGVRPAPIDTIPTLRARMDLLLAAGQAQRAQRLAAEQRAEGHPLIAVPLAWAELLLGRLPTARRVAAQALWHELSSDRERIELLLVKALAARRMGEQATSAGLVRQAMEFHHATGVLRPFAYLSDSQRAMLLDDNDLGLDASAQARLARVRAPYPGEAELVALTPREQQLVALLAASPSRQAMADELYVSINTIKKQLATLYRKLGVATRDEALVRLARVGLLPDPLPCPEKAGG